MATVKTDFRCDLTKPVQVQYLDGNLFTLDNGGNTINVYCYEGEEPATLGGSVSANVIRPDGTTVPVSGAIDGNKAYVILPQAAYAVPGCVTIVIKVTQDTTVTTIAAIVANNMLSSTDAIVDPGTIIPSVQALIAQIETAIDSIPADYSALLLMLAKNYSSSKTYIVGEYAWEAGVLKRCIVPITAGETYTAAHWTDACLGDDVTALKSAFDSFTDMVEKVPFNISYLATESNWVTGARIAPTTGARNTNSKSARTGYCPFSRDIYIKMTNPNFTICVWAYTSASVSSAVYSPYKDYTHSDALLPCKDGAQYLSIGVLKLDGTDMTSDDVADIISGLKVYTLTDNSLTVSGAAADAKAVGEAILKSTQNTVSFNVPTTIEALIDSANWVVGAGIGTHTGGGLEDAKKCRTGYIQIDEAVLVYIDDPNYNFIVWEYTGQSISTAVFAPRESYESTPVVISKEQNAAYFRLAVSRKDNADMTSNDVTAVIAAIKTFSETDKTLTIEGASADAKAVGDAIKTANNQVFECYANFTHIAGWWQTSGKLANLDYYHSQLLTVRPETDYYCGYWSSGNSCYGAWFDFAGNWIAPVANSDLVEISASYSGGENTYIPDQANPDQQTEFSNFVTLFKFRSPAKAAYLSINLSSPGFDKAYRNTIASKEMFIVRESGNVIIRDTDPFYQKYRGKKLCIIGPSSVMINRLSRNARTGNEIYPGVTSGYIAGFQEYLRPYFAEVKGYGYSSASYATGRGSSTGECSIYTRVCGGHEEFVYEGTEKSFDIDPIDLSGYDVFILTTDGNGLTTQTIGEYTDETPDSYIGAIKGIIEYIMTENPKAEIYMLSRLLGVQETEYSVSIWAEVHNQMKLLHETYGYAILDMGNDGCLDNKTGYFSNYTYDNNHMNCIGNLLFAEVIRKQLVGF